MKFPTTIVMLLLVGACKSNGDPSCEQVGAAYAALVQRQLAREYQGEELGRALRETPQVVAQLVEVCRQKNWSPAVRRCVLTAKTAADLDKCHHPGSDESPPAAATPSGKG
jgi:hypothetical protein